MEILNPNTSWTIVNWRGRTFLVQTKVPPKNAALVTLNEQVRPCDAKQIFSIIQTSSTGIQSQGQSLGDIFSQFSIPETFEIITWLNHYLNYFGFKLKIEDSATVHRVRFENKQRASSLITNAVNQFKLLLRTEIPLTHSNLRLWFQYWQEPKLAYKLVELINYRDELLELLPDSRYDLEIPNELSRWTSQRPVVLLVPSQNVVHPQSAAFLQPEPALNLFSLFFLFNKAFSFERATDEIENEKIMPFMNLIIDLAEQMTVEKLLNSALKQSNLLANPFYCQIPIYHDGNLFHVNMLFFKDGFEGDESKQRSSQKKSGFDLVVEIPTANLGLIIADIKFKHDEFVLTITAAEPWAAEMIKANIDQINELGKAGKAFFKSITVNSRDVKELRPKRRLLDIVFEQAKGSVDLRI